MCLLGHIYIYTRCYRGEDKVPAPDTHAERRERASRGIYIIHIHTRAFVPNVALLEVKGKGEGHGRAHVFQVALLEVPKGTAEMPRRASRQSGQRYYSPRSDEAQPKW